MNLLPYNEKIQVRKVGAVEGIKTNSYCHCKRCGWSNIKQHYCTPPNTNNKHKLFDTDERKYADANTSAYADTNTSAYTKDIARTSASAYAIAGANIKAGTDAKAIANAYASTDEKADANTDVKADAGAIVKANAELNILTYHKSVFIEMVRTFRKDITIEDINNEISIYQNELKHMITHFYLLKDFKNEIYLTLLPILQIIFINNNIKKELSNIIIQEIQNILEDNDQLILLLMEFSIFLKILQPYIYVQLKSIQACINKFLNVRIQSNDTKEEIFMIFNNQNMVLYNIFFLFSKKIFDGSSNLILTTEFLELTINKKIKNIMQISKNNKYKRINLHLFQCTQCSEIFDNELVDCCPCGQTFCSKTCQIAAWGAWHKKICPNRQVTKSQCLGCMEYFEKQDIFKCTQCMIAKYCSKECQRGNWAYHKAYCNAIIFDSK